MKALYAILNSWTTICVVQDWFILNQEARDAIEDSVLNGDTGERVRLEIATEKNGSGTGEYRNVQVISLANTVKSAIKTT